MKALIVALKRYVVPEIAGNATSALLAIGTSSINIAGAWIFVWLGEQVPYYAIIIFRECRCKGNLGFL